MRHLETNGVIHCGSNLPMDDYKFSILLWLQIAFS